MTQLSATIQHLVTLLLREEVFSTTALDHILEQHQRTGGRLADFLLDSRLLSEADLLRLYANDGYGLANLETLENIETEVVRILSANLAYLHKALPFKEHGNTLDVAFLEPPESATLQTMKGLAGREIRIFLAPREILHWAITKHYPELLQKPVNKDSLFDPLENRIGHRLIKSGLLTKAQLNEALLERTPGKAGRTGEVLLRMGYITEEDLYRTLAEQLAMPFAVLPKNFAIPPEVAALFSKADALRHQSVPIAADPATITMLTCEPNVQADVQPLFERKLLWKLTPPSHLKTLMFQLENEFDPLCNLLVAQGHLRLEQRAQAQLQLGAGESLEAVLLAVGVKAADLERAKNSLPQEQVIPLVRPWEGMIDLFEPPSQTPNPYAHLESMLRRIVREELERFRQTGQL
jgi:Type II secretion system (T2SS), protein E, N-terminal domain